MTPERFQFVRVAVSEFLLLLVLCVNLMIFVMRVFVWDSLPREVLILEAILFVVTGLQSKALDLYYDFVYG